MNQILKKIRHVGYIKLQLAALVMTALFLPVRAAEVKQPLIELVKGKKAVATIIYSNDVPLYGLTAGRLAAYIEKQTDIQVPVTAGNFMPSDKNTTVILDGTTDKSLLGKYGLKAELKSNHSDTYLLKTVWHNNMPFIILAGNSPSAVSFAAFRLMEELEVTGKNAFVRQMDIRAEPFFKNRLISMGNIWQAGLEIERKYNIEAWPVDKILKSVDMYNSFGFNGLEVLDRFNEGYLTPCYGITREEWRNKIWAMADRAHLNGQKVYLRAWGNAVMADPKKFKTDSLSTRIPRRFENFCPDLPEDRKRWETEIRDYYVPNYANHIDVFMGHWADRGGCKDPLSKATIDDCLRLQMELQDSFRKINPEIQTSFSFWRVNANAWRGYQDHHSVSASPILNKDVVMVQATRSESDLYSAKLTSDFIADGHKAAVWSWSRADVEAYQNDASMLIRTHSIGKYFSDLPTSAKVLEWHNIERCQHGLGNVINFYVAGKLLWNPKANVDTLMQDFAVKMFGENNAPYIVEAYNVMEKVRVTDNKDKPSPENPRQMTSLCQKALKALDKVKLDPNFRPRLDLLISPQQIKKDLVDALTVIKEYSTAVSEDLPTLDSAIKAKDKHQQEKLLNTLKVKIDTWDNSIAGLFEARAMEQELNRRGIKIGEEYL
jgi:hypothetical protein